MPWFGLDAYDAGGVPFTGYRHVPARSGTDGRERVTWKRRGSRPRPLRPHVTGSRWPASPAIRTRGRRWSWNLSRDRARARTSAPTSCSVAASTTGVALVSVALVAAPRSPPPAPGRPVVGIRRRGRGGRRERRAGSSSRSWWTRTLADSTARCHDSSDRLAEGLPRSQHPFPCRVVWSCRRAGAKPTLYRLPAKSAAPVAFPV